MTALDTRARTPWHLWAVVVIGVLWNGFGAYDYVMSHTAGEPYFRSMGMTNGAEMGGQTGMIMNAVILAACLFFVWYSRLMAKRGVLR